MGEKISKKTLIVIAIIIILFIVGVILLLPKGKKTNGPTELEKRVTTKTIVHMEDFTVMKNKIEVDGKYLDNTVEVPTAAELEKKYSDGTKIDDLAVTFKKKGDNVKIEFEIYNDSDKDVELDDSLFGCSSTGEYDCDSITTADAGCYKEDSHINPVNAGDQLKKDGVVYCELTAKLKEEITDPNGVTINLIASWIWK